MTAKDETRNHAPREANPHPEHPETSTKPNPEKPHHPTTAPQSTLPRQKGSWRAKVTA
jgi:hypothetical protein